MIIDQVNSIAETLRNLPIKDAKMFLFNTDMPTSQALIDFDVTDAMDVYANCVGMVESRFTVRDDDTVIFKPNSDKYGIKYKGTGMSSFQDVISHTPNRISTSLPSSFHLLSVLTASDTSIKVDRSLQVGDYIDFEFEWEIELDSITTGVTNQDTFANFRLLYWNTTDNSWVQISTVTNNDTVNFVSFDAVTTTQIRLEFTASSVSNFDMGYISFESNNDIQTNQYANTSDVQWALLYFDLENHALETKLKNRWPFIFFPVGDASNPNVATLDTVTVRPSNEPRLIHAEFVGKLTEDI